MATGWIEQKRRYRQYKARTEQLPARWISRGRERLTGAIDRVAGNRA